MYFKEFLVSHFDFVCFVSFLFKVFTKSGIVLENIFNMCEYVHACARAHTHTHTKYQKIP